MSWLRRQRGFRLFLAEDDAYLGARIASALDRDGHTVVKAADGRVLTSQLASAFLGRSGELESGLVVAELRLPQRDGIAVLRALHRRPWCPPFVLLADAADPQIDDALELGALDVLVKPVALERLRDLVVAVAGALREDVGAEVRVHRGHK